jgi:carbon-monoxide dehydrogenase medium subunit
MYDFNFHRPTSIDEVKQILAANADAKLLAGGMTLLPTMKLRLAQPSDLVDLSGIDGLDAIRDSGSAIEVGAMARHADVASSDTVRAAIPALADLAGGVGDAQVRNRGTLGGSIANSDPAADYPAAVLALNATIKTDRREIAVDDYFLGMFETALTRYAIVGVMVAETEAGIRVAVTGAGACAFRASDFEAALTESFSADALDSVSIDSADLNSDLHASAEFRTHLVSVMAKRAVDALGG